MNDHEFRLSGMSKYSAIRGRMINEQRVRNTDSEIHNTLHSLMGPGTKKSEEKLQKNHLCTKVI